MKKGDKILVICIIVVAILGVFSMIIFREEGKLARVSYDGQEIMVIDLLEDIEVDTDYGNSLKIEAGKIWVEHATCPDGLCIKQGEIFLQGHSIICLPNKTVIEIIEK